MVSFITTHFSADSVRAKSKAEDSHSVFDSVEYCVYNALR